MIAWKFRPRWVGTALLGLTMVLGAGSAVAEVDIAKSGDSGVMIAGSTDSKFFFGTAELTDNVMLVPLQGWVQINGAGNGTGINGAGNGTGESSPETNGAGNGTGINGAGNGTGDREFSEDWGTAIIALGCHEAAVGIYRENTNGELIEEEFNIVATNICVE